MSKIRNVEGFLYEGSLNRKITLIVPTVHSSESLSFRMSVISKVHNDNSEDGIGFLLPKRRENFYFHGCKPGSY